MRPMKFDYLPSSPPDPIDVAHLERENAALRARVAELEAERDRYLCALDRIATPGYCPDPRVEAAMVLGRIPKD